MWSVGVGAATLVKIGDRRRGALGQALAERVVVSEEVLDGGGERGDAFLQQADLGPTFDEVVFELGVLLLGRLFDELGNESRSSGLASNAR